MKKIKALVTRKWPADAEARLNELFDVTLNMSNIALTHDEFVDAFQTYDVIFPTVSDVIPAAAYAAQNARVKVLANFGVGYNHLDVAAANAAGIVVTNTPGVLTDCTADLTLGLMINIARRIGEGEREVRSDNWTGWRPSHLMGAKVTGATLGIIGYGRIAQAVAHRAHHGFGMNIQFYNRSPVNPDITNRTNAVQLPSVEDVLPTADFVSLHCPATPETYHLMNADRLAAMKSSAYLINTARGDVVDETALIIALQNGDIAGAGLDVYENEPKVPEALKAMRNVLLAPHLGSATYATRLAMANMAIDNAVAFFNDQTPPSLVTG